MVGSVLWVVLVFSLTVVSGEYTKWVRVTEHAEWPPRALPGAGCVHNGSLVVMGGRSNLSHFYNDVWSSEDSAKWVSQTLNAPWHPRAYHEVVSVGKYIILMGGQDLFTFYNDVWRSADGGKTWKLLHQTAPWGARVGAKAFVAPDGSTLWLMGGSVGNVNRTFHQDMWQSKDAGVTWTRVTDTCEPCGRAGIQVVALPSPTAMGGHQLILMGGDQEVIQHGFAGPYFNDVWGSVDAGVTWKRLLEHAPWSRRTGHQCIAVQETVYCAGGFFGTTLSGHCLHDVWRSRDGLTWSQISDAAWGCTEPACAKYDFYFAFHQGKLWTVGGDQERNIDPGPQDNDVWEVVNVTYDH